MDIIYSLAAAIAGLISAGSVTRLIILGIQMAMDTEDKASYKQEIKHVLSVLIISLVVTSGGLIPLLVKYIN